MLDPNKYRIEVFKVGEFKDSSGQEFNCSLEELKTICNTYNEAVSKDDSLIAPIVKGHPDNNDPAYGWVEFLEVEGDSLWATIKDVDLNFAQEVREKKYQKVSISVYPENLMLRHIGFLGAVPPAVKGLANVDFSELDKKGRKAVNYYSDFLNFEEIAPQKENENPKKEEEAKQDDAFNFSINLIEKYKRDKPEKFKDYKSNEFADPTHYRFPLKSKSDVKASLAIFSRPNSRSEYSDDEQQLIAARLVNAMAKHGIKRTTKIWKYNEVNIPIDMLTKTQLQDFLKSIVASAKQNENKNLNNNFKEGPVDPRFEAFIQFSVDWIAGKVSEEQATQFQADADAWIAANPDTTSTTSDTQPAQLSENEKAMQNEIAQMKEQMRLQEDKLKSNEFNEFLNNQEHLTPPQRAKLLPLLMMVSESDNSNKTLSFMEPATNTAASVKPTELIKGLINDFKISADFSEKVGKEQEKTTKSNLKGNFSEESQEAHEKILNFIEEQKTKGINYTYAQAVSKVGGIL